MQELKKKSLSFSKLKPPVSSEYSVMVSGITDLLCSEQTAPHLVLRVGEAKHKHTASNRHMHGNYPSQGTTTQYFSI